MVTVQFLVVARPVAGAHLFRLSVLLLPEVLVILGLAVWWWRRSL